MTNTPHNVENLSIHILKIITNHKDCLSTLVELKFTRQIISMVPTSVKN